MDKADSEKAWQAFWASQQSAPGGSVLSLSDDALTHAQFDAWAEFCTNLEHGARVLDLGTGSGKLPQLLQIARPDLSIVGIDMAKPLPEGPQGITLMGGLSMEDLPFANGQFDAAVSQFGFEYGDTELIAAEVLRVVTIGGPIGLMVHRGDGPILAHNLGRKEQIAWVIEENSFFDRIKQMLPEGHSLPREGITFAAHLASRGSARFGPGSAAWEIPEAVRRTLIASPNGTRNRLTGTLDYIAEQANAELARIGSLAEACANADDRERLLQGFARQNRIPSNTSEVRLHKEPAFADLIVL